VKVHLIVVGKTKKTFLKEGEQEYAKRLSKFVKFEKVEIPDLKNAKNRSQDEIKIEEGKLILSKLPNNGWVVLLDDKGKSYDSKGFAQWINEQMVYGQKQITFVIGGAYGFSDEVYQRANQKLSLSKMTFSHQMVRLFFIEQLYRSYAILNNLPYHHE
jgi:23S rRNA (pseudouridine1915-N3)-methyltransferase